MPVHLRRGLDFENRDFYRVSKIEDNFKCHFSACYGLFSLFTFEKKRNWLRVIGTLKKKKKTKEIKKISLHPEAIAVHLNGRGAQHHWAMSTSGAERDKNKHIY